MLRFEPAHRNEEAKNLGRDKPKLGKHGPAGTIPGRSVLSEITTKLAGFPACPGQDSTRFSENTDPLMSIGRRDAGQGL